MTFNLLKRKEKKKFKPKKRSPKDYERYTDDEVEEVLTSDGKKETFMSLAEKFERHKWTAIKMMWNYAYQDKKPPKWEKDAFYTQIQRVKERLGK